MSTSLCPIANHKIEFKNKSFQSLANEIKEKLDRLKLENIAFLKELSLSENSPKPEKTGRKEAGDWSVHPEDEYYKFAEDKYLNFNGPFDLDFEIDAHKIHFFNPGFSYREWLEKDEETRNKWRKYYYQVTQLLGGDRVIYLADNSHPLEKYMYLEIPLEKIENKLLQDFGEPKRTFEEVLRNYNAAFYADRFKDIK